MGIKKDILRDKPVKAETEEFLTSLKSFKDDHRSNPGLHKLYIGHALEDLQVLRKAEKRLREFSRWPANQSAQIIADRIRELCIEHAHFHDAAALLFAHADLTPYQLQHRDELMGAIVEE